MTGSAQKQNIERRLYDAYRNAEGLLPTTAEEVAAERKEQEVSESATSLPEHLRDPRAVLARIKASEMPHVFGDLIGRLRTQKKLSIEQLAEKARVSQEELVEIESDPTFEAKPRTVHQLANLFGIVPRNLIRLANLTEKVDSRLSAGAVRFAACSKMDTSDREQRKAVRELVKLLNKLD